LFEINIFEHDDQRWRPVSTERSLTTLEKRMRSKTNETSSFLIIKYSEEEASQHREVIDHMEKRMRRKTNKTCFIIKYSEEEASQHREAIDSMEKRMRW
jgi:hypothetical protein